eukprot:g33600.t1
MAAASEAAQNGRTQATTALSPGGHFAQELPLSWVRLRDALEDAAEGSTGEEHELPPFTATFVLSLAQVRQMSEEAGVPGDTLIDCLRCLHDFGSIVFFDEDGLRDHVVLNPQWLADAMAHILNCPRVVQGHVAAAKRLRQQGELEAGRRDPRHRWKPQRRRLRQPEA